VLKIRLAAKEAAGPPFIASWSPTRPRRRVVVTSTPSGRTIRHRTPRRFASTCPAPRSGSARGPSFETVRSLIDKARTAVAPTA